MAALKKRRMLARRTLAKKSKPPTVDRIASTYAVKTAAALRPVFDLVMVHVLPLADPDYRQDAPAGFETIVAAFAGLRAGVFQRMLQGLELEAWRAARGTDAQNREEFRRVLRVEPFEAEPWLGPLTRDWITENASLVRTTAEGQFNALENAMFRMIRGGESMKDIRRELQRTFDTSVARAKLIARDQVSKYNGQLNRERQTRLGVTEYVWHTVEDARVRPDHGRLDGLTFRWSDPPVTVTTGNRAGERNHPGGDIQCRCWPEPVLDELLA